jgi:hypothetical protein
MLSIDEIIATAKQLSKPEKVRLINELVTDLADTANSSPAASQLATPTPTPSVREILTQLGPNPTPDEVEAARQALQAAIAADPTRPVGSLYGIWAHYGVSVSEEDIAEARREMWGEYVEGDR